jgi:hypothetical protein
MTTEETRCVTSLTESDRPAMRALFAEVFGSEMSDALWLWKYGQDRGRASVVWNEDGGLTAHYGGMARAVLDAGKPCLAVQIGDVMVRQRDRRNLARKGPFFLAASHFLDQYIGYGKPFLYGFGFPNKRAMQVAERLGLYAPTGQMNELVWQTAATAPLPWWVSLETVSDALASARDIETLWTAMARALPNALIGVRDAARLQYRYLDHPTQAYAVALLRHRLTRQPLGLVVLRHHEGHSDLLDLLAPPSRWDLCARAASQIARGASKPVVSLWLSGSYAGYFCEPHEQRALDVIIPCNCWSPGPDAASQQDRWCLMGGDTDFM